MTPAQKKMADAMSEKQLQDTILERCEAMSIRAWHDNDSRRNRAGLPDLVIIGNKVLWAELKSQKGKLRDEQVKFLTDLEHAGQHVVLWRPQHLFNGAIDRTLNQLRKDTP